MKDVKFLIQTTAIIIILLAVRNIQNRIDDIKCAKIGSSVMFGQDAEYITIRDLSIQSTEDGGLVIQGMGCEVGRSFCGDGNLDPYEDCDDGNNEDGDGCSAVCGLEGGYGISDSHDFLYVSYECEPAKNSGNFVGGYMYPKNEDGEDERVDCSFTYSTDN